jgi:hypothetical protein
MTEWNRTIPAEIDQEEMTKVGKKLESAKVKLARESNTNAPDNK